MDLRLHPCSVAPAEGHEKCGPNFPTPTGYSCNNALHRLGVYGVLGRSLKTTNGLESINALIEERCAKVDHWQNSSQRQRWLATALLDIEPRLRKVMGYRHLPRLRDALKRELKIDTTTSKTKAA